jgi:hypothetical protein
MRSGILMVEVEVREVSLISILAAAAAVWVAAAVAAAAGYNEAGAAAGAAADWVGHGFGRFLDDIRHCCSMAYCLVTVVGSFVGGHLVFV